MAELAIARTMPAKRAITIGSAFGSGVLNGYILKANPTVGFITTLVSTLGSALISMFTKGLVSEIAEGFAAGGAGAFGILIPGMMSNETVSMTAAERMRSAQAQAAAQMRGVATKGSVGVIKPEFADVKLM